MGITEFLINLFTDIIAASGYAGVGALMTLESMVAPVPSEAVMPFAGFLWYEGRFTLLGIIIASTAGSILGSLISYWIGMYAGRPFVKRFGKYVLLNERHLELTERFFQRYGDKTVFISRFIPVIRHFISIPAGVGRMAMGKFILYTAVGAGLWNTFLAWLGYELGSNWTKVEDYTRVIDIVVLLIIAAGIVYLIFRRRRKAKSSGSTSTP